MDKPEQYMLYWGNAWRTGWLAGVTLSHLGSEQLGRRKVAVGDTIWVVTVEAGRLYLLGRLVVGEFIVGQGNAEERLGETDLWVARYHVLSAEGTEEDFREVDITDIAEELRFHSERANRLHLVDHKVSWQQLQTMRTLTPATVALLESVWGRGR